jgi:hypothetical protein
MPRTTRTQLDAQKRYANEPALINAAGEKL